MSFKAGDLVYYLAGTVPPEDRHTRIAIVIGESYRGHDAKYTRYKAYWLALDKVVDLTSHGMRHVNDKVYDDRVRLDVRCNS